MKSRKVTRYYCDFCKRGGFSGPAMVKHERGCTANPGRVCGMCAIAGLEQKPLPELIATLEGSSFGEYFPVETPGVQKEKELREATVNCPACILATLRQNANFQVDIHLDWKAESKAWLELHGFGRESL